MLCIDWFPNLNKTHHYLFTYWIFKYSSWTCTMYIGNAVYLIISVHYYVYIPTYNNKYKYLLPILLYYSSILSVFTVV